MSVRVEDHGPLRTVTIDRPGVRNAVDRPTADALEAAFRAFDSDDALSVAILTGADGTFCAGADLQAIDGDPQRVNRIERGEHGPMGPSRLELSKPVVAAIEGYAVAGGLELALWCDLRVMAEDATLGVFCRRWGVPLIDGGTARLPRIVGLGRATDLILTGRPVAADEAFAIALVDRVVPSGTTLAAAVELATSLAAFPQACLRADLVSARRAFDAPLAQALLSEHDRGVASITNGEMTDGVRRFTDGAGRGGASA